jgi:hypothetical protein
MRPSIAILVSRPRSRTPRSRSLKQSKRSAAGDWSSLAAGSRSRDRNSVCRVIDSNGGRNAHEFYVPDGLLVVGHNRFQGQDKIREFYAWCEHHCTTMGSSLKTIRHLISNLFIGSSDGRSAKVLGIVSLYGAAARPPAQSKSPLLVADLTNECVLDDTGGWHFKSHMLHPVFMSHEAPPSIAIDTHRAA